MRSGCTLRIMRNPAKLLLLLLLLQGALLLQQDFL
jgi:hypothetical protein